jgi:hypothetical protein
VTNALAIRSAKVNAAFLVAKKFPTLENRKAYAKAVAAFRAAGGGPCPMVWSTVK